ncbi:MAG: aminotransferase class III-fold pyridoxal phosphate-dependent enzyme, partial [Nitriliruptoraceae bacterium]
RRHGKQQSDDKYRLVTLEGGFHGRTMATLEATGQPAKHAPFAPLAGFVDMVPHDDPVAVAEAVTDETCAVLVEVIQGEGGVRRVPDEVLVAARNACDEHNALLMIDEVQTGMGRTGNWFAFQQTAVVPDVITLAKALGNGLPIGACVARGGAADVLRPGDHATTFGGNPVTCAAARAVIATIEAEDLLPTARERSEQLQTGLLALVDQHDVAVGVRGQGLLVGLEVAGPHAAALEQACSNRRLITNAVATNVLRIAPPLTVSETEIAHALEVVDAALGDIAGRFQEQE